MRVKNLMSQGASSCRPNHQTEVLVVGAGPVGLFAALKLADKGIEVAIIDKHSRPLAHSYALALHPSSLGLLATVGLAERLIKQAQRWKR